MDTRNYRNIQGRKSGLDIKNLKQTRSNFSSRSGFSQSREDKDVAVRIRQQLSKDKVKDKKVRVNVLMRYIMIIKKILYGN